MRIVSRMNIWWWYGELWPHILIAAKSLEKWLHFECPCENCYLSAYSIWTPQPKYFFLSNEWNCNSLNATHLALVVSHAINDFNLLSKTDLVRPRRCENCFFSPRIFCQAPGLNFIDWLRNSQTIEKKLWLFFWSIWYYEILRIGAFELKAQVYTRNACQRLAPPNRTKLKRLVNAKSDHDRLLKHDTSRECMLNVHGFTVGRGLSALPSRQLQLLYGIEVSNKRKSNLFTSHSFISHASFFCARTQNRWWARRDDEEMFRTICT